MSIVLQRVHRAAVAEKYGGLSIAGRRYGVHGQTRGKFGGRSASGIFASPLDQCIGTGASIDLIAHGR